MLIFVRYLGIHTERSATFKYLHDVLIFKWGKCNSHTGIKISDHLFIHSMFGNACSLSSLKREAQSKRLALVYRLDEDLLKGFV